ncbi:MAG TPA: metal-dependent hydrolase [Terriglobales bacterium]|jgi:L-ascorbate metabolism protein UlaG (beta-lactamase superfamily)|nr:metal-dependent hydrolase [Terriglobales bacterium]
MDLQGLKVTWLGHSCVRIETTSGSIILIDPWCKHNPACPEKEKDIKAVDLIMVTHGHSDHMGDVVEIAKKHKPVVIGIFELCAWFGRKGVEKLQPMNKGGSQTVAGVRITMVHALHSSGVEDEGQTIYAGDPCGYVLEFDNGLKIYHAGDTAVFSDMQIIHDLYKPDLALLPIGDHFTMGPREATYACRLLRPKAVIPIHHGTFPMLTGTPAEFKHLASDLGIEIIELKPGETLG